MVNGDDYIDIELEEKKRQEMQLKRRAANRQKIELPKHAKLDDYYALLGLSGSHITSTEEDIKNAYRRVSLTYHPDKAPPEQREEAEQIYKAMQEAYDTLIDPNRRRIYDSTREFDDTIPGKEEGKGKSEEFFKIYEPVFKRNSWFSKKKPIPSLGDMETPDEDVHAFYDFWLSFQSWREFKHEDEHKVGDAESREERRWMERENRKLVAEQVKAEKKRIRKMVNNAMEIDPRLLRIKQREKEAKEAKKRAKLEARLKREAERKRLEDEERREEERKKKEEEDRRAKEKANRETLKKLRKNFKRKCKKDFGLGKLDVDEIVERTSPDDLKTLYNSLTPEGGKALLQQKLADIKQEKKRIEAERERERQERKAKARLEAKVQEEEAKKKAEWSDIELMWLSKAVSKYPSGCHNRWTQICNLVNLMAKNPKGKERTEKDVIKQTRIMNNKKLSTGFSHAYNKNLKFKAGDDTVLEPSKEPTKDKSEHEEVKSKKKKRSGKKSSKKSSKDSEREEAQSQKSSEKPSDEWSAIQQKAFETALRETAKGPERWDNIASKVPGKTKKDCVRRFKEIRAKIMAQRAAKKS
uniref:DnaJ homolog subfamily C member 2 n=1 Tax=Lotharella globosa TaxID=91324 RepID=A0A7S3Z8U4_9EUKA